MDIRHRIGITAPAAKVYDALATTEGIAGWWTRDTTGQSMVGGVVTTRFMDHGAEKGRMDLEVVTLDPGKEVGWRVAAGPEEWIGTDVTFRLTHDNGMTIVDFGHRNWKEPVEFMAHCSMKWATFLLSLRDLVETGEGRPAPGDLKIDNWN